jgi:hypothetical protein
MYEECDKGVLILVKAMNLSGSVENNTVMRRVENFMNLCHPCISGMIGVVLPSPLNGFRIVRMQSGGDSLSEIILRSPEWWTPTAKAKAVARIVMGLRFAHTLGLYHCHLTGNNIFWKGME